MALIDAVISEYNNGLSKVTLTFDDVTLAVTKVAWFNTEGHWSWTIKKSGQPDIVRVIPPGSSGSVNVPAGYTWATQKGQQPNFTYEDTWTRA